MRSKAGSRAAAWNWNVFFERRLSEVKGLLFMVLALFLFVSLVSWSSNDPGIHRAVGHKTLHNWGGFTGAYVADFIFWAVGLAIFPYIILLGKTGLYHVRKKRLHWSTPRVLCACFLVFSGSLLGACLPKVWLAHPGGLLGEKLYGLSTYVIDPSLGITIIFAIVWAALCLYTLFARHAYDEPLGIHWRLPHIHFNFNWPKLPKWFEQKKGDPIFPPAQAARPRTSQLRAPEKIEEDAGIDDTSFAVPPLIVQPAFAQSVARAAAKEKVISSILTSPFALPSLELLHGEEQTDQRQTLSAEKIGQTAKQLEVVLKDFGVQGKIVRVNAGPVVTLYELEPSPGTKSSRVISLSDDIARSMAMISARVAIVPGRNIIGIELPNTIREKVFLRTLLETEDYQNDSIRLPLALGKNISGAPIIADLSRMPHLLVAGTTGSGKSVSINAMILSLIYNLTPDLCKLILIDPKMLELSVYDDIPHLLAPVVTEPKKAIVALKWVVKEMENRYRFMAKKGVRNIFSYNQKVAILRKQDARARQEEGSEGGEEELVPMPYIVVVIDEMADLMLVAGKEIEAAVQRLAQMARAAGIHMIMATQRPSVDVITGTIKANFPTRISFQVTSKIDSRTILGEQGAEQLLGQGDMLFMQGGGRIVRLHGPFVSDQEIEDTVAHLKAQGMAPQYLEEVTEEPEDDADGDSGVGEASDEGGEELLYQRAVEIVLRDRKPTISYLQRCLRIGYNTAARQIERMEANGIISPQSPNGKRDILQ